MRFPNFRGRGPWPLPRIALAAGVLALPLAGCDTEEILEVEDPTYQAPETLFTEAGVPILVAQALGDFQIGYGGDGNDSFLSVTALITDEFYNGDTFPTRTATDRRDQFPTAAGNTSDEAYEFLQLARRSADVAADATEQFFGADDPRIARLRSLQGYTYIALADAFCSNIPFSETTREGVPDPEGFGQPLTTLEVYAEAVESFNAALAIDPESNLASVGKGRALLNRGEYQAAAAAVADVPTTFSYKIEFSDNTARQNNPIQSLQDNGRYSVADEEGGNGLPFRSALDPRVPWIGPFEGFSSSQEVYIDLRYPTLDSDVPLATGIEARLIEAEAALQAGDVVTWLAKLNDLRADVFGLMALNFDEYEQSLDEARENSEGGFEQLTPLTDPGTQAARVDLMFRERAFWLYTTGQRLGDLRRLARPESEGGYGRDPQVIFPTGPYPKGGAPYGVDVAFPVPFEEINNPNYTVDLCDVTQA